MLAIRAWSRLFQWLVQSSSQHENNCAALLAFHSNVLVTSNVLSSIVRSFLWQKFRKHQTYLHICSGLETYWSTSQPSQTGKQTLEDSWEAGSEWDGPDQPSKNHWLHSLLLLLPDGKCMQKQTAYLLPQSREHLASGWHLTAFSCSRRGKSQGQPIQPGRSAKVAVPSWGNGSFHFFPARKRERLYPPTQAHYPKARRCQQSK